MAYQNPADRWPHLNREAEYRVLLPAAVQAVAVLVEAARPGWGERLTGPEIEAAPARWPLGVGPDPQTPAGQWIALYRDLRTLLDTCTQAPDPELRSAERLVSTLSQAVWAGSQGDWDSAVHRTKRALLDSWQFTGIPR
ncbi:hypothetical protein ABT093_19680 [Kitasatospora sp. NPDC002551]|uniref:hypothetical protein n=1 Tax=Kitasatospora sp. NPDC002551 TaxID=3154539 RepID=UPI00331F304D